VASTGSIRKTANVGAVKPPRSDITRMVSDHKIDNHRIFITGLSAGGVMTSVMLASYPFPEQH
jgi:poly(3-hydroxybutyrate) depolymerase